MGPPLCSSCKNRIAERPSKDYNESSLRNSGGKPKITRDKTDGLYYNEGSKII